MEFITLISRMDTVSMLIIYFCFYFLVPYSILLLALTKLVRPKVTTFKYMWVTFVMMLSALIGIGIISFVSRNFFISANYYDVLSEFNGFIFLKYILYKCFVFGACILSFIAIQYIVAINLFPSVDKTKLLLWLCIGALYLSMVVYSVELVITEGMLSLFMNLAKNV